MLWQISAWGAAQAKRALGFFGLGGAFGLAAGFALWKMNRGPSYHEVRGGYVQLQATLAGQQDTVVLGDSVIESTWFQNACGRTFNAGVGGATVEEVHEIARAILPKLQPSTVIVSVGANHFWNGDDELADFEKRYRDLVEDLPKERLVLVGVPNSNAANLQVQRIAREIEAAFL